jgi:hypothetical protein
MAEVSLSDELDLTDERAAELSDAATECLRHSKRFGMEVFDEVGSVELSCTVCGLEIGFYLEPFDLILTTLRKDNSCSHHMVTIKDGDSVLFRAFVRADGCIEVDDYARGAWEGHLLEKAAALKARMQAVAAAA